MVNENGNLDYYVDEKIVLSDLSSLVEMGGSILITGRLSDQEAEGIQSLNIEDEQPVLALARKVGLLPPMIWLWPPRPANSFEPSLMHQDDSYDHGAGVGVEEEENHPDDEEASASINQVHHADGMHRAHEKRKSSLLALGILLDSIGTS